MDTTQTTHISLCTGYGGIDLGLRRVLPNLRTVAYAEIEAFAIECLLARMECGQLDAAPIWSDLKSFPWESFRGMVDILSGGYPCQPFSAAGLRKGSDDPRHLWPFISDGIRRMAPRLCFFENVEGHISLGLSSVISDLEELGFEVSFGIFSAAECGAPHQRKRVFILAVSSGFGGAAGLSGSLTGHEGQSRIIDHCSNQRWPNRPGQPQHAWEPPRVVGNATNPGQPQWGRRTVGQPKQKPQPERPACNSNNTECKTQPTLGGDSHGSTSGMDYAQLCVTCDNRTDELRLLGNGVVPATAELAFRTLINEIQIAAAS